MGNGASMICKCVDPCNAICDKKQSLNVSDWDESPLVMNSKGVDYSSTNQLQNIKNKNTNNNLDNKNFVNDVSTNNKKSSLFNSNINANTYMNTNSTNFMSKKSENTANNLISGLKISIRIGI